MANTLSKDIENHLNPTKWNAFHDDDEIGKIHDVLTGQFPDEYSEALKPKGTISKIVRILSNEEVFENFSTYHNPARARNVAIDIAGLGVIEHIINKYRDENVQDIGYNSSHLITVDTAKRKFVYQEDGIDPHVNIQYMDKLIKRMSQKNGMEGQSFVSDNPLFNGSTSIGNGADRIYLRISGTNQSLSPNGPTLSVRVSRPFLALNKKNFAKFAPTFIYHLLRVLVKAHSSIVISAETGAGKTELQKLLIGFIDFDDRIVMIEDTDETHLTQLYPDRKDIYSWVTDKSISVNGKPISITSLIAQSLRNNPKWLIVAESRKEEAYELISGARSGHPIITTLHATSNAAVPGRFIGMSAMAYKFNEEMLDRDILTYLNIGIHLTLKPHFHGTKIRYMDQMVEYVPRSKEHPDGINVLFQQHIDQDGIREYWTGQPTEALQDKIYAELDSHLNIPKISKEHMRREKIYDFGGEEDHG